jgi:hypothetical protein
MSTPRVVLLSDHDELVCHFGQTIDGGVIDLRGDKDEASDGRGRILELPDPWR